MWDLPHATTDISALLETTAAQGVPETKQPIWTISKRNDIDENEGASIMHSTTNDVFHAIDDNSEGPVVPGAKRIKTSATVVAWDSLRLQLEEAVQNGNKGRETATLKELCNYWSNAYKSHVSSRVIGAPTSAFRVACAVHRRDQCFVSQA